MRIAGYIFLLLALAAATAQAQTIFAINWFTVAGASGTSTGGVFAVTSLVGMPDASGLKGQHYRIEDGIWSSIAAVPAPDAPRLSIFVTTTNTVMVAWPASATGWTLQQNTVSPSSSDWSNVTATAQNDGTTRTLIISPPTGNRFYRLWKQ